MVDRDLERLAAAMDAVAKITTDGDPDLILKMPSDSLAPFLLTIAMAGLFVALLLRAWWLAAVAGSAVLLALVIWLWPERELAQIAEPAP